MMDQTITYYLYNQQTRRFTRSFIQGPMEAAPLNSTLEAPPELTDDWMRDGSEWVLFTPPPPDPQGDLFDE